MHDDRLVTVARYDTTGDAQLAKTQLEAAGIPCMLTNAEQSGLAPMFASTRGGVHVKAAADQAAEARAILSPD